MCLVERGVSCVAAWCPDRCWSWDVRGPARSGPGVVLLPFRGVVEGEDVLLVGAGHHCVVYGVMEPCGGGVGPGVDDDGVEGDAGCSEG